jgi:cytochrome c oxidase assembly factor CtaG
VSRVFTSWTLDVPVLVAVLLAGAFYLAGVRRVGRPGDRWPAGPVAAFCGGLGVLVLATMSFVGVYQDVLFWIRAVQTILLLLTAPLFLALGRPLSLAIAAAPRSGRRVQAVVGSRPARVLTFPAVTALVLVIVPFVLYFTSWYSAGLHSRTVAELTYLALLVPGLVFFWTLLRVDPVPRAYPYLVALWVTAAEVVGDAILGLAVIADQHLIAGPYYLALARPWGPSLRSDQVIGGGALWLLGDLVGLPFLAAQLIQMIREDEGDAARIDAELDAADAELAAADAEPAATGPAGAGLAAGSQGDDRAERAHRQGLWWHDDPRFASRFQPPPGG